MTDPKNRKAREKRQELKERGPDELLMAAGFQPQRMKWIPFSPERYPQMAQISFWLDVKITQQNLETLFNESYLDDKPAGGKKQDDKQRDDKKWSSKEAIQKIETAIKLDSPMVPASSKEVMEKFKRAINRIASEGIRYDKFTAKEAFGLFTTVLANNLTRESRTLLGLRIVKYEFQSLFLNWYQYSEFKDVTQKLESISKKRNAKRL